MKEEQNTERIFLPSPNRRAKNLQPTGECKRTNHLLQKLKTSTGRLLCTMVLLCVIGTANLLQAQTTVKMMGAEASNLSKSYVVDKSTGIMHYNIPLYNIITSKANIQGVLSYTGIGVKCGQRAGNYGLNWHLNYGGELSRQIRGGIIDEKRRTGHLYHPINSSTNLATYQSKVNKRETDGESDIFTVVCNNKQIRFIIYLDGDKIKAKPLTNSNFKINCISEKKSDYYDILSWEVSDDAGIKYTYDVPELTSFHEHTPNGNNAYDSDYTSSWKLSKIEVPGESPISFSYVDGVDQNFYSYNYTEYKYGKAMQDYSADFESLSSSYYSELDNLNFWIQKAMKKAKHQKDMALATLEQTAFLYEQLPTDQKIVSLHTYEMNRLAEEVRRYTNIIGVFINSYNSNESIISNLDQLQRNLRYDTPYLDEISSGIIRIKDILGNLRSSLVLSNNKLIASMNQQRTIPKLLKEIKTANHVLKFEYKVYLRSVQLERKNGQILGKTNFGYYGNNLSSITFHSSSLQEFNVLALKYFDGIDLRPGNYGTDPWGYYRKRKNETEDNYFECGLEYNTFKDSAPQSYLDWLYKDLVDSVYVKYSSLQSVENTLGGKIMFDYESNDVAYGPTNHIQGGIRLKSVSLSDNNGNNHTTRYKYSFWSPQSNCELSSGRLCNYNEYTEFSELSYSGSSYFTDRVSKPASSLSPKFYANVGNNGIFYVYVEEISEESGKIAYRNFAASDSNDEVCSYRFSDQKNYPYWMQGKLLSKACYNENNQIVYLENYQYLSGVTQIDIKPFIESANVDLNAISAVAERQISPCPYTLDLSKIRSEFPDSIDPITGVNPQNLYNVNFAPRENLTNPQNTYYSIVTNCKAYLKQKSVYVPKYKNSLFEWNLMTNNTIGNQFQCIQKSEYFHESDQHNYLTKIEEEDSKGNSLIRKFKYPEDVPSSVHAGISGMLNNNLLDKPVKIQNWRKKSSGTLQLLGEKINLYKKVNFQNHETCVFDREYVFRNSMPVSNGAEIAKFQNENLLFSENLSKYSNSKSISYENTASGLYAEQIIRFSDKSCTVHNPSNGLVSLLAEGCDRDEVFATEQISDFVLQKDQETYARIFKYAAQMLLQEYNLSLQDPSAPIFLYEDQGKAYYWQIRLAQEINNNYTFEQMRSTFEKISNFEVYFGDLIDLIPYHVRIHMIAMEDLSHSVDPDGSWLNADMSSFDIANYSSYPTVNLNGLNQPNIKVKNGQTAYQIFGEYSTAPTPGSYQFTLVYSNGSKTNVTKTAKVRGNTLNLLIDLTEFSNHESITSIILSYNGNMLNLMAAPAHAVFEGFAYDAKDRLKYKVNQNMQMEYYEYDNLDRVVKITDARGNILQEYQYHIAN
jgi:YD repeat-containing protein